MSLPWAGLACALLACAAHAQEAAPSAAAGSRAWHLDPAQTFVTFEVRHFGTSTLRGRLGPLAGDLEFDRAARRGDLRLRIPMSTLSTGQALLDKRLGQPDLLAVAEYPDAYFLATRFRFDDAGEVAEVRGEFILRGISQPLSLFARRFGCRQDAAWRREVCGGDFEGELHRGDFGANFGEPFVADAVHLVVQVEAIAPG